MDKLVGPGSKFEGRWIDSGEESMLGLVWGQEQVWHVLHSSGDMALKPFWDSVTMWPMPFSIGLCKILTRLHHQRWMWPVSRGRKWRINSESVSKWRCESGNCISGILQRGLLTSSWALWGKGVYVIARNKRTKGEGVLQVPIAFITFIACVSTR